MGPFSPLNLKGTGYTNGIPVFRDKLPLTRGGLAGDDACVFGRYAYQSPNNPNVFVSTAPTAAGYTNPIGVFLMDPTIQMADPGMNDRYYEGRPCTIITFGELQFQTTTAVTTVNIGQYVSAIDTKGYVSAVKDLVYADLATGTSCGRIIDVKGPNGITVFFDFIFHPQPIYVAP
jgi:hypothetical protein